MIIGWSTARSSGIKEKVLEKARRSGGEVDSGEIDVGELGYGGELSRELYGEYFGLCIGLAFEISLFPYPFSESLTGIFTGRGVLLLRSQPNAVNYCELLSYSERTEGIDPRQ